MAAFAHPPREGDREGPAKEVFLHAGHRSNCACSPAETSATVCGATKTGRSTVYLARTMTPANLPRRSTGAIADHLLFAATFEHLVEVTLALASEARHRPLNTACSRTLKASDSHPKVKA